MENLRTYAEWIEQSFPSIRKKDVKKHLLSGSADFTPMVLAYKTSAILQAAVCNHSPLTSTCSNIGKTVLMGHEPEEIEDAERTITRVNVGYFLINVLFDNKILTARRGRNARDPYTIAVKNDEFIDSIFYSINVEPLPIMIHTKPLYEKPTDYVKFTHEVGGDMVHKCNPAAKKYFTYDLCPAVFDTINKAQSTAYKINTDVLDILLQCKEDEILSFRKKKTTEEQFIGLKREQTAILDGAVGVGDRTFWQHMFFDFRGRLYSSLIYLSPQGSKMSKGLFKLAEDKPIGAEGWYWLLVHTANCFGQDKLTLDGRINYANERLDEWMVWAQDPVKHKDWQESDSPFEFLAAIMEVYKALTYKDGKYNYPSGLMVSFDATCSGLQVLTALTKDSMSADLCNLSNNGERGDYYMSIADSVWPECVYNDLDAGIFDNIQENLSILNKNIKDALNQKEKTEAYEARRDYIDENRDDVRIASRVFWGRPEIKALARKIVKRPCMTYFYSCEPKTMARSLMHDFQSEPGFEGIQMTYCLWLTNRIYKTCKEQMPIATQMMEVFIEMGKSDWKYTKDFTIVGPNGFMFMQNYRNPLMKKVKFMYKEKRIGLQVLIGRGNKLDYKKITSATSPNAVHMLDSQLVSAVLLNADYDVNCIHDSFATCPADASKLFEDIRICFVNVFNDELLLEIETQKGFNSGIQIGNLDINNVLDDDYCFS